MTDSAPCLGCGLEIDASEDYCPGCWDDISDWLGWGDNDDHATDQAMDAHS